MLMVSCHVAFAGTGDVLRTIAELNAACSNGVAGLRYDVTAKMLMPPRPHDLEFYALDETGATIFGMDPAILRDCPTNAGDIVSIKGIIVQTQRKGLVGLHSEQVALVAHGDPPAPIPASPNDIYGSDRLRFRLVSVQGTVYDAFRDEIDHHWSFIVLNCNGTPIYVAVSGDDVAPEDLERLIGATASVDGIVADNIYGSRITLKRHLSIHGLSSIKVLSPGADPFVVPEYSSSPFPLSANAMEVGRRRISGHVIAAWDGGGRVLIRTDSGNIVRADLKSRPPPHYGEYVEASGFPATDLYRRNLSRAVWRAAAGAQFVEDAAMPVRARDLFIDKDGHAIKNASLYGRSITLRGTVHGLPPMGTNIGRMYLECDSFMVPVDVSECPDALNGITEGCVLDVSGTYVIETDNWLSNNVFPQIKEILVAVRTPKDVVLVARPPWWTTKRLIALIAALVSVILGIIWWNVALRRRAELRGKKLADEQVAHISSELKVVERTRLAVELHDLLSQTLTGVSMGISSIIDTVGDSDARLKHPLELTSKMVEACRNELRNCLWDLRSRSLEEEKMDNAIRIALAQVISTANVAVRFNVPRSLLTDNTAHAILCIVRELATNAIRHGKASCIKVAGCIERGRLLFAVSDNGCGFDTESAPGVDEGHFGLQGIRERVERLNGEMSIKSTIGKGTNVSLAIEIPAGKLTGECIDGKDQGPCCR